MIIDQIHTLCLIQHFQMVWEQGSVVMVDLTRLMENSVSMCHRYWPEEGTDLYHIYEVCRGYCSSPISTFFHALFLPVKWFLCSIFLSEMISMLYFFSVKWFLCSIFLCKMISMLYFSQWIDFYALFFSVKWFLCSIFLCEMISMLYFSLGNDFYALFFSVKWFLCSIFLGEMISMLYFFSVKW